jgi:hypothetical protein
MCPLLSLSLPLFKGRYFFKGRVGLRRQWHATQADWLTKNKPTEGAARVTPGLERL